MTVASAPGATNVRVQCQASHPDRRGERCGAILGDIPAGCRFVGTATRRPSHPDDLIRLQCTRRDCKTWNLFAAPDPAMAHSRNGDR